MKDKLIIKSIAAYIATPLIFTLAGIGLGFAALGSTADTIVAAISLATGSADRKSPEIESIYVAIEKGEAQTEVDETADTVSLSDITMPAYGQIYGKISVPAVGIELDLFFGDGKQALKLGAGQYIGSSIPGRGRPILIAGHNTPAFFGPLENIAVDDEIFISTSYGEYRYRIYEIRIADMNDTSAYDLSQDKEVLILYTCYPFSLGFKSDRMFVYGERLEGPDIVE